MADLINNAAAESLQLHYNLQNFSEIATPDPALIGGKCANLAQMIQAGIPVPPGYALDIAAYDYYKQTDELPPGW